MNNFTNLMLEITALGREGAVAEIHLTDHTTNTPNINSKIIILEAKEEFWGSVFEGHNIECAFLFTSVFGTGEAEVGDVDT